MSFRAIRWVLIVLVLAGTAAAQSPPPSGQGSTAGIAGIWILNPALTERPQEIGFTPDWQGAAGEEGGRSGGGRERRGGSGSGGAARSPQFPRQSVEDGTRVEQLTGEARTPPAQITIVQKDAGVSIADDQGHVRTFHPTGRLDELTIGTVPLPTTARWNGGSLVVLYDVASGRQLRYTYTPAANPTRLLVEIRFLERGREGDDIRLTYEPPEAHARAVLSGATTSPPVPASTPAIPDAASAAARPPVLPPGSELRGLTTIGTVVEDVGAQGIACGLDQTKIKTSIARLLADAGFKTRPDSNEETYVLLAVLTSRLQDGTCVSRYDASLMTQADATFPYLKGLVSVQVQLLHDGGMAGGSPAAHTSKIMDALTKSVNGFVTQIRAVNK